MPIVTAIKVGNSRMFRPTRTSWRIPFACHLAHRSSKVRVFAAVSAGDRLTESAFLDSLMLSSPIIGDVSFEHAG